MADPAPLTRKERRPLLMALSHDGVMSRTELREHGWDRNAIAREVRAERWKMHGSHTVALHTGPLSFEALCWRAIFEVGPAIARIDGVTALQQAGLENFEDDIVHVSVDHIATIRPVAGVHIHKVCRRVEGEAIESGLPRTRPTVAAIRAAHWAVSDRQAAGADPGDASISTSVGKTLGCSSRSTVPRTSGAWHPATTTCAPTR